MHDHSSSEKSETMRPRSRRRLPIGAEVDAGGVSFRLWAPARERCFLVIEGNSQHQMTAEDGGYFCLHLPGLDAGTRYHFTLEMRMIFLPILPRVFSRMAHRGHQSSWTRRGTSGVITIGKECPPSELLSMRCTSAPSQGKVPLRQPGKSWKDFALSASTASK